MSVSIIKTEGMKIIPCLEQGIVLLVNNDKMILEMNQEGKRT